jgi:general secretion pathway protein C
MDAAKRFTQWRLNPSKAAQRSLAGRWPADWSKEQWLTGVNTYLPTAASTVLVLLIAYQLAALTWTVLPGEIPDTPLPATATFATGGAPTAPRQDFSGLVQSHLFGEAPVNAPAQVAERQVVEAPDTTLSLRLTGIVFGEGDVLSLAHIAGSRNQEKTYRVGQAIEDAGGATLHSVYGDRVILNRDGRLESLRLPKELSASTARTAGPRAAPAPAVSADSGSLRQVISENASRLTDILRLTPHVEGGQVVGFRVNPGRDRETFAALGLMPGDVVTDINGTVLDDPSRGLQVFEALGEATMANVTVLRDGAPQVIVVDTSQLESLEENRE